MLIEKANIWKERYDLLKSGLSFILIHHLSSHSFKVLHNSSNLSSLKVDIDFLFTDFFDNDSLPIFELNKSNKNGSCVNHTFPLKSNFTPYKSIKSFTQGKESLWILEKDQQEQADLLAAVSHDLRSPINSITGLTNLLETMLKSDQPSKEEMMKFTHMIKLCCSDAIDFTNDVLEMANIQSNRLQLEKEAVSMNDFIKQYINTHRLMVLKKQIKVNYSIDVNIQDEIRINKIKITRVFDNLLSNAVKFSHQGSQIDIALKQVKKELLVIFSDHGVGMSKEMLRSIFVKFGKSRRQGLAGEKSHGLGMSIVKQIMELHGGNILINSKEGTGTKITLKFNRD